MLWIRSKLVAPTSIPAKASGYTGMPTSVPAKKLCTLGMPTSVPAKWKKILKSTFSPKIRFEWLEIDLEKIFFWNFFDFFSFLSIFDQKRVFGHFRWKIKFLKKFFFVHHNKHLFTKLLSYHWALYLNLSLIYRILTQNSDF